MHHHCTLHTQAELGRVPQAQAGEATVQRVGSPKYKTLMTGLCDLLEVCGIGLN